MTRARREHNEEWWRYPEPEMFACPPDAGSHHPQAAPRHSEAVEWPCATPKSDRGSPLKKGPSKLTDSFIKGPIDLEWVARASRLRKPALVIGVALWREVGLANDEFLRKRLPESAPITVRSSVRKKMGMSTAQMSRGIHALADAGLIEILTGGVGRVPVVVIRNVHVSLSTEGRGA